MSISVEAFPLPLDTPSWTGEAVPEQTASPRRPLVPDDFVEDSLLPDDRILEDAIARHRRQVLLAGLAVAGLLLGVTSALLL